MSHIETGNTKMSLPVFVDIANVLEVQTDDLLYDKQSGRTVAIDELIKILEGCTNQQVRIVTDVAKATKIALDKYE